MPADRWLEKVTRGMPKPNLLEPQRDEEYIEEYIRDQERAE
jgi:hypothetical protein